MSLPVPNEGDRPSRLQLDRFAAGELKGTDRAAVQAWLDQHPEGFAHLEALKNARKAVRRFDAAAIRERAGALVPSTVAEPEAPEVVDDPLTYDDGATVPFVEERSAFPARAADAAAEMEDETPEPAPTVLMSSRPAGMSSVATRPVETPRPANRWLWAIPAVLVAAAAAVVVLPAVLPGETVVEETGIRVKGAADLDLYRIAGSTPTAYAGEALGEGDVVGFRVPGATEREVVVLSVDGTGAVTVFHPAEDGRGAPLADEVVSVTLDGAPGPEVFVAVFDRDVAAAKGAVVDAWQAGGAAAVEAWAGSTADADAVVLERR